MAPSQKACASVRSVQAKDNGWRERAKLYGTLEYGPQRAARADAEVDLYRARRSKSGEDMTSVLASRWGTAEHSSTSTSTKAAVLCLPVDSISGFEPPLLSVPSSKKRKRQRSTPTRQKAEAHHAGAEDEATSPQSSL